MGGVLHYQSRGPIARCFWKGPRGQPSRGFAGRRSLSRDLCLGQWMLGCQDRSHRGSSHKSRLRPHGWFLAPPPPRGSSGCAAATHGRSGRPPAPLESREGPEPPGCATHCRVLSFEFFSARRVWGVPRRSHTFGGHLGKHFLMVSELSASPSWKSRCF